MFQAPLFPPPSLTVSEITRYLRELFDSDEILREVWVQGEISNLSRSASGHIYFTLKDQSAALKCVIWKQTAWRMPLTLQNGMAIEAHGAISIYERDGQYQLYADAVRLTGEGALYQEFLRLKARLEAEGLFATERKKPLPELPAGIGVVTSATGAALQDILNTLRRRFPLVEVVLAPCAVQGEEAPGQIVNAIRSLNRTEGVDLILAARGGGSLEDLWAFNDARVVRAIAASPIPVITGVGHETDTTLADYAADLRAPTPTAAAVLATPDVADLAADLRLLGRRLAEAAAGDLQIRRATQTMLTHRLGRLSPAIRLRTDRQQVDMLSLRLGRAAASQLQTRRAGQRALGARLAALNPQAVLARGYAILTTSAGQILRRAAEAAPGQHLTARLSAGALDLTVNYIVSEE